MAEIEEVKILKERLREVEQNCVQAAEYGKALLEENMELKTSIDNMGKQYSKKIESLEQDNYSQSLKIEAHVKDKKWFGDEITQLKNMHTQKQQQDAVERSQAELEFRKQINELKSDYDQAQAIEKQLKEKIEQLEELLQQQLDQTQITSKSFNGEELNDLQEEILKLKTDNTALTARMIDAHTELKCSQDLCQSLKSKLVTKDEEIQEIQCNMTSYCNHIEKLKTDNSDLSTQLEALRIETDVHNNKGNSIFSELEDRRVEAEKRLISLRVKNDSLKEELVLEKQLHQKSKSQMVLLLNMNSSRTQGDSAIESKLYARLDEAKATIKELTEKVEKYEDCEGDGMKVMSRADFESKTEKGEKGSYEHFLRTMLETKESEVTQLNSELRHKNLQFLDVSNKLFLQEKKVVEMEKKQNLLQNQNFKLSLKNEELLLKHEPENMHNKKQTFKKEKLPIFEETVEPILTLKETCSKKSGDLSSLSSSTFKPNSKKGDNGDTVNVDGCKVPASYLTTSNKVNVPPSASHGKSDLPYRRSVKISKDLEVMDTEGNIEKQVLADDDDSVFPRRLKAAPKPSTEPKVKQVEIDPEKVIQCNQQ